MCDREYGGSSIKEESDESNGIGEWMGIYIYTYVDSDSDMHY